MSGNAYPTVRRLRRFAFDPGLSNNLETANVNSTTLPIPWELLQIAIIEAFRRWGINPTNSHSLSENAERWQTAQEGTVDQSTGHRLSEFIQENEAKVLRWNLRGDQPVDKLQEPASTSTAVWNDFLGAVSDSELCVEYRVPFEDLIPV